MNFSILEGVFILFWSAVSLTAVLYSFYLLATEGFSQDFFNFFITAHVISISQQFQIARSKGKL